MSAPAQSSQFIVFLVFVIFFVISFLTNILGPLVPDIITGFRVTLTLAAVLPFSFFIAYGVMSIPAGFAVERWGEKKLMVASFALATSGALGFALMPTYHAAVVSLFVMGSGMAALQVAINPLLRVAGGEQNFAFNSAFAQLVFGGASFASPLVYSYLVTHLGGPRDAHEIETHANETSALLHILGNLIPPRLPWVSIYWLFAVCTAVMAVLISLLRLPTVERKADESAGTLDLYCALLRNPIVWLYFLSVAAYVGSEQGTADWMGQFLYRYHGFDPHDVGAAAVSRFWGLLTAGCLLGMLLLKLFDSRTVLIGFSLGALLMLTLALFGKASVSLLAFPAIGLFASIMWPTLVSLALNSVPAHQGPFAGILCTGIMGGAVLPLLIGKLGDLFGLRLGLMLLYVTFACVLSVGFWARPIIGNSTVTGGKKPRTAPVVLTSLSMLLFLAPAQQARAESPPYLDLSQPEPILETPQAWEGDQQPHTLSIVELNRDGYRYWGWYGLNHGRGVGLARSNDLVHWIKFEGNPLSLNARWPSVLRNADPAHPDTLYMALTRNYDTPTSHIVLAASRDGIHLTDLKVLVRPVENQRNQNPNLFKDPVSGDFFLTFYRGNDRDTFDIVSRRSRRIEDLDRAAEKVLLHSAATLAAPNLLYVPKGRGYGKGVYYLATEIFPNRYNDSDRGVWQVKVFVSDRPDGRFDPVTRNPVEDGGRACLFQHLIHGRFYGYQCRLDAGTDVWHMELVSAPVPK